MSGRPGLSPAMPRMRSSTRWLLRRCPRSRTLWMTWPGSPSWCPSRCTPVIGCAWSLRPAGGWSYVIIRMTPASRSWPWSMETHHDWLRSGWHGVPRGRGSSCAGRLTSNQCPGLGPPLACWRGPFFVCRRGGQVFPELTGADAAFYPRLLRCGHSGLCSGSAWRLLWRVLPPAWSL